MILVTGAAGHVGNVLVRELVGRGERVRALALPEENCSSLDSLDVEIVRGTVLDPASFLPALSGVDTVYHLAGIISIQPGRDELMRQVNVTGTWNVARAAREAGVRRFVHVSSVHALARPPRGRTIDERVPFDPHNAAGEYDRTKAEASLLVLSEARRGLGAVIACPTGIIGPWDFRGSEMGRVVRSWMRPGFHPIVDGTFDFVDVRDVARALVLLAERGASGEVYIIGRARVSLREMFDLVRREIGSHSRTLVVPHLAAKAGAPLAALAASIRGCTPQFTRYSLETLETSRDIDHGKLAALGWQPRPIGETMRDIVRWWAAHPLAAPVRPAPRPRRADAPRAARERIAVVTGASSGIGAATARRLAAAGYRVVLAARREDRLSELAREIGGSDGAGVDTLPVDLARPEGPRLVFDHVMERYGTVDVLVNNAGLGWYGYASDMPWLTAQEMMQVNNAAMVQLSVAFLPVMRRVDRGHIVNVSSIAGSLPSQGVALYSATKSFVDAFSTALYRELRGTRVHVSVVKPGPVLTEFYRAAEKLPGGGPIPAERFGVDADTVAVAIMRLLARPRRARYVPGLLRVTPWIEFSFGWLIDRLGPLLLKNRTIRA